MNTCEMCIRCDYRMKNIAGMVTLIFLLFVKEKDLLMQVHGILRN
jgi:hypothetical protein